MLAALDGTDVPAPRLIAACTDETVMGGAVFYLMESVARLQPHDDAPAAARRRPGASATGWGWRRPTRSPSWARSTTSPSAWATSAARRASSNARSAAWLSELESYAALDGYPGPEIPGLDDVAAWLEDNRPRTWRPGIMHGDYHLANLLYSFDGPEVAAIVDWEMCTIGDPLLDLGWLIATWPGEDNAQLTRRHRARRAACRPPASWSPRYAARTDRDLSALTWYAVLACFKLGIVLEGTHARAFAGKAPKDVGDLLHAMTLGLFARALTFMEG